jgi:NADH:ubiquinone oxidoreductase subunit C
MHHHSTRGLQPSAREDESAFESGSTLLQGGASAGTVHSRAGQRDDCNRTDFWRDFDAPTSNIRLTSVRACSCDTMTFDVLCYGCCGVLVVRSAARRKLRRFVCSSPLHLSIDRRVHSVVGNRRTTNRTSSARRRRIARPTAASHRRRRRDRTELAAAAPSIVVVMSLVRACKSIVGAVRPRAVRIATAPASITAIGVPSSTVAARTATAASTSFRSLHTVRPRSSSSAESELPGAIKPDVSATPLGTSLALANLPTGTLAMLAACLPKLVFGTMSSPHIPLQLLTTPDALRALTLILKSSSLTQASLLSDIVVTDRLDAAGRFSVKYLFLSLQYNQRWIVEVFARETTIIPSLAAPFALGQRIFSGAGWLEREAYDLYGIYFSDHGDLRRILTDYGFTGHPMRKDFPLTGFTEVVYNDAEGRVTPEPVELSQEFRVFHL